LLRHGSIGSHGRRDADAAEEARKVASDVCADLGGSAYKRVTGALSSAACTSLVSYLTQTQDSVVRDLVMVGKAIDVQVDLTVAQLAECVGSVEAEAILRLFLVAATHAGGAKLRAIKLRRVKASGDRGPACCIPFHVDTSLLTMQIALNDDTDYEGGRLTFVTPAGFECPPRPAGTATIHGRENVHGVTELRSGTRCSLFLLA